MLTELPNDIFTIITSYVNVYILSLVSKKIRSIILNSAYYLNLDSTPININLFKKIQYIKSTARTHKFIKKLLESLTYLDLPNDKSIKDDCIQHLPRTLTHLDLHYNKKLTDEGIQHLPRTLTELCLSSDRNFTYN